MTSLGLLSNEQVADEITTWSGRIAAGEARRVELIGEFDRREAWGAVGILSCAHWLSWRLGMGMKAAHERVRVARALTDLPVTRAAFLAGRLSWTQVRAITRVASPADEQTFVDLAKHATGAQIERLVRGVRRAQRIREDEADPPLAAHKRRARISYDADGDLVLNVRLSAEEGAIVLAAIEAARAELDRRSQSSAEESSPQPACDAGEGGVDALSVEGDIPPADRTAGEGKSSAEDFHPQASIADAVLHLARRALDAATPDVARRGRSRLVVNVDPLSGWGRLHDGELLPPVIVRQTVGMPETSGRGSTCDLTREDLGRTSRLPSLALRELLGAVDGERCRFPGCTRHRRLHAHHVEFWSAGGRTDLANLVLVCSRHHTLVHSQGFLLTLQPDRSLHVHTADGTPLLHHPALPWQPAADLDPNGIITAATLPPAAGDPLQLHYVVGVLMQQAA